YPLSLLLATRLPPTSTLFPYTTLFRSGLAIDRAGGNRTCRRCRSPPPCRTCARTSFDRTPPPEGQRASAERERRTLAPPPRPPRSEEHTSELQSRFDLVCRLLLEKKKS